MRELLLNPFPTLVFSNLLNYPHNSYCPVGFSAHKLFHQFINVDLVLKSCNGSRIMNGNNGVSLFSMNIPRLNLAVQSSGAVEIRANVGTLVKCEEGETVELVNDDEEELEESSREWKLPPWGDVEFQEGINFQSNDENLPKISEGVDLVDEGKVDFVEETDEIVLFDEGKVHFLEETDEIMLSKRILILSRKNKVRSALELFRSMQLTGLLPSSHALNSLLVCLLRNELFVDGLRIFEFMKMNKLSTGHTYSLMLKAVADAHGFISALEMFTRWDEVKGFDAVVYNTMISICGKENDWVEAERIWRLMEENGCSATRITYCLLVSSFTRCHQNDLAIDAYVKMVQNNFEPGNDTMQAIIGASSKEGKWDFALRVFQDMLKCELQPNLVASNALIHALGKAKKVTLAFKVYNVMKSLGHSPDVYTWNALLRALYEAYRYNDVIQLFGFIKREYRSQLNIHICNTLLMSCSKLGLWDRAVQILWEMEASGLLISASSYNIVISACEMARRPEIALQVYERMIHQKHTPDTFTHLSLIRCCIWGSLWDEVEALLNKSAPDVSLYNAAIQGMCLRRKTDLAKQLYMKMREKGIQPDGKTRAMMLQNLPKKLARQKNRCASRLRKRHK